MPRICLILLIVFAGTASAESPFNVDCFFGWGGCYRPMEWTPVEIGISSTLTEPFAGTLNVSAQQDGLNTLNIVHDFVLTPDIPLHIPLVTKLAFAANECSVKIIDERGRTQWHYDFELWDFSSKHRTLAAINESDLLIGLVGQRKFGLLSLSEQSACESQNSVGKVYLKDKFPQKIPWDWTGFVSLDLLILYNPDWNLFNQNQLNAIAQWVSNGGKLLLILGNHPLIEENPIAGLLPFEVRQPKKMTVTTDKLENWGLNAANPEAVVCWPIKPKKDACFYKTDNTNSQASPFSDTKIASQQGPERMRSFLSSPNNDPNIAASIPRIGSTGPADRLRRNTDEQKAQEYTENKECLFATGYVGFGRVGVLAFDPSTMTDIQKTNSTRFWVGRIAAILEDRTPGNKEGHHELGPNRSIVLAEDTKSDPDNFQDNHRYSISQAQVGSNRVTEYLYNIAELRPLSIWWVILLLTLLAVLLGPVDYKVLKRINRLPLTWVTSAFWIILFSTGAYYGVQALRSGKMQCRVVSVLDGIQNSDCAWATEYCGLFAPYSEAYQLKGLGDKQWWSGIAPAEQRLYAYRRKSSSRNIHCFQHDGSNLPYSLPINIWTMQCLVNESPIQQLPVDAAVKRIGDEIFFTIVNQSECPIKKGYVLFDNDQAAGFGSVGGHSTKEFTGRLKPYDNWNHAVARNHGEIYSYDYDMDKDRSGFRNEAAYSAQGCSQRTRTINAYLKKGAAVVCAEFDKDPVSFAVKDHSCDYTHTQLVRLVVFPKSAKKE